MLSKREAESCKDTHGESVEQLAQRTERLTVHDGSKCEWKESDLPRLPQLRLTLKEVDATRSCCSFTTADHFDVENLIQAEIVGARLLTQEDAVKRVWHLEVDIGPKRCYSPGDAFGFVVENDEREVKAVFSRINASVYENTKYLIQKVAENNLKSTTIVGTARKLLAERVDLRAPVSKSFLRALSQHCTKKAEREYLLRLCSKRWRKEYIKQMCEGSLSLLSVLDRFRSCCPSLEVLLNGLPPLQPRWYSTASAPNIDGSVVHFAFSVISGGLATGQLEKACQDFLASRDRRLTHLTLLPRTLKETLQFRPPELGTNYIMIGPMTGVAPFRGFLRQRQEILRNKAADVQVGKCMLFFGCRSRSKDFIYREELEKYANENILTSLHVAFSRDTPEKVYVQNKMLEASDSVASMVLEDDALIYLCGDGGAMARAVDSTLETILTKNFDGDPQKAKEHLKEMIKKGRYRKDVWFWG